MAVVTSHNAELKLVMFTIDGVTHALDPAVAKAVGESLIDEANLAMGKPAKPCRNCGVSAVYDRADAWRCMGCGMSRKEAEAFVKSLNEEKQGGLDV